MRTKLNWYRRNLLSMFFSLICCVGCRYAVFAQEAPLGAPSEMSGKEEKALQTLQSSIQGKIVWSTSRAHSKHDIWIMDANGNNKRALTNSDNAVDWFPRFSPDGKIVLFVRSKSGWVPETDAEYHDKWDLWAVDVDGSNERKMVSEASWGTWHDNGKTVVFARNAKVFIKDFATGEEQMLFDGDERMKKGTSVQQPRLSLDGKYLAATLRGSSRETGIWHFAKNEWYTTGGGCQINWFPGGNEVYRVNPTGNGGTAAPSEILAIKLEDGKPIENVNKIKKLRMMDLPGRRSHEYFPKFDQNGEYMVWCATDKGHDHDLYDYEVYLWKRGWDAKDAVRLTFHSGNDRWPDLFVEK